MEKIQAEVPKLNREQINFFLNLNNPEEKQKLEELAAYREKNAYKSTPLAARALLFQNLDTYEEMQDLRRKNEEANTKITEANIKYADATSRYEETITQLRAENKQQQQSQQATIDQLQRELLAKSKKLDNMAKEAVSKIQNTYDLPATVIIEIAVAYFQDCLKKEQSWSFLSTPIMPSKFINQNQNHV